MTYVTLARMAKGSSGRIVIEVDPLLKQRLYTELARTGKTLKDWFTDEAHEFCAEEDQPYLFDIDGIAPTSALPPEASVPNDRRYSVVSMFSGCGGMDLGFLGGFDALGKHYRSNPFDIVWANDLNEAACRTYARNIGNHIRSGDIWDVFDTLPDSADVIVGGFPCQDISVNGKRAGVSGKRSGLYRAMVKAVDKVRPRLFVAENVRGLLFDYNRDSLRKVVSDFNSLGYHVTYRLYRATEYGIPQIRERVFIIGLSDETLDFIPPRPTTPKSEWVSAREAMADLETIVEDREINHIWSKANKSPEQGSRILKADKPAHTIRAECHGNIQFHYSLPRRISMREAARVQSFPDEFIFESGLREMERQIGNAVPPVLAWYIAQAVLRTLTSSEHLRAEATSHAEA